ncbi:MAG TPA: phosphoglycerate kinase [Pyrinomonadaceae bacterium]|nr:phosphoglycerate kinase [Pyrinomonadaceae bacterium]
MYKKTIREFELENKNVFIRVDFNVPIKKGKITDDTRLVAALDTINFARQKGAKIVLASHLGRPLKKKKEADEKGIEFDKTEFSLRPVYEYLRALPELQDLSTAGSQPVYVNNDSESLGSVQVKNDIVFFAEDCIGPLRREALGQLQPGQILLLENLRFHPGEEKNDPEFSKQLAENIDVYVNDAFGAAHRAHASTEGITKFVKPCVAGFLMERELDFLTRALESPQRPFIAILGGAKISDKIPVIESLIARRVDKLIIGGAMAYTFFKAKGITVGKSLVEDNMLETALQIENKAAENNVELLLPSDHQVVDSYDPLHSRKAIPIEFTNAGLVGLDIGPETIAGFTGAIQGAKTIIWNGPMGMFEEKPFDEGTIAIAKAVADATANGALSIVGGGDSVAAVNQSGLSDKISHLSTGGGATLEFLAGKTLPGVEALDNK